MTAASIQLTVGDRQLANKIIWLSPATIFGYISEVKSSFCHRLSLNRSFAKGRRPVIFCMQPLVTNSSVTKYLFTNGRYPGLIGGPDGGLRKKSLFRELPHCLIPCFIR